MRDRTAADESNARDRIGLRRLDRERHRVTNVGRATGDGRPARHVDVVRPENIDVAIGAIARDTISIRIILSGCRAPMPDPPIWQEQRRGMVATAIGWRELIA